MPTRWAAINRTAVSFRALLYGALAHQRRAVAMEHIERGLKARGAGCDSIRRSRKPNSIRRLVVLGVVQISVVRPNAGGCIVSALLPHASLRHLSALPPNPPL